LSGVSEASRRQRTTLHYLNGRIDVEAYFPLDVCSGERSKAANLRERLQTAIEKDPVFNQISVFFG